MSYGTKILFAKNKYDACILIRHTGAQEEVSAETSANQPQNVANRKRTSFTTNQLKELEITFAKCQYISPSVRSDLALKLGLLESTIQVGWLVSCCCR